MQMEVHGSNLPMMLATLKAPYPKLSNNDNALEPNQIFLNVKIREMQTDQTMTVMLE